MPELSSEIFKSVSPYRSAYETNTPRWLFVCSAGMLRSPTAARVAQQLYDVNTRSCGIHSWALVPFTYDLAMWADKIVFMHLEYFLEVEQAYKMEKLRWSPIEAKCVSWQIPDKYKYMESELVTIVTKNLESLRP